MNISQVAKRTQISAKMIRYYEDIALIPKVTRNDAGYRKYSIQDIERLTFIAHARQLGFSLDDIKALMKLRGNEHRHCADVKVLAQQHVAQLQERIMHLQNMVDDLEQVIVRCAGDDTPECAILQQIQQRPNSLVETDAVYKTNISSAINQIKE